MTVYVDDAAIPATVPNGAVSHTSEWSHLTADTKAELHAFAARLGLRRSYFQDKPRGLWHYDVTKGKRFQALRMGAVAMPYGEEAFALVWHKPGREGWHGTAPETSSETSSETSEPSEPSSEPSEPSETSETSSEPSATRTRTPVGVVDGFDKNSPAFVLSNFGPGTCLVDGVQYPYGEHGFNAAKTTDPVVRAQILLAPTPREAKRLGSRGGIITALRPGWDRSVRYEAMTQVVSSKFAPGTEAAAFLLSTGDDLLLETNTWHDQHWGSCVCDRHRTWPGRNELGKTLMRRRAQLRGDAADRWVRVMCTGHRDKHLNARQREWMHAELARVARKLIEHHGMRVAIHGGANGADLAWARAADDAGVDSLWAYLPFPDQTRGWDATQRAAWEHYTTSRERGGAATRRWTLGEEYDVRLLHARNEAMIRDAHCVVAVLDPNKKTGGTASAIRKIGATLPVVQLDVSALRTTILHRNQEPS